MSRGTVALFTAALLSAAGLAAVAAEKGDAKVPAALNFTMTDITGKPVELSHYQGKVVMLVNVASKCGYTPQYRGLEKLYEKYAKDGLVVIGVPANEFGKQEPGTDAEIQQFCSETYKVTFPMMSKAVVKGPGICPLYKFLTSKDTDPKFAGDVKWNFEKFLIGRSGEVVARFRSPVEPDAPELVKAVEAELQKK
ncbi:MAG TPA: glutathione peroxidase [Gemmataceae bacterium]|jgi:glutathione peroxidase|nr:glutathione peroxidase [Gemmataceae bacterium]